MTAQTVTSEVDGVPRHHVLKPSTRRHTQRHGIVVRQSEAAADVHAGDQPEDVVAVRHEVRHDHHSLEIGHHDDAEKPRVAQMGSP